MIDPLAPISLERRALLTAGGETFATAALDELGVRSLRLADGPMAVTSGRVDERDVGLLTPCGTALAASWDLALVERVGRLLGAEARRTGVDVLLAPNLNLPRSPLAGRAFEQFSEDPFLTAELAAAWIAGVQSQGVGTAPKHLAGNDSETNRHSMNSVIDERALHEVYLLPFEHAVGAGAWMLMTSYNRLNGAWTPEHRQLLRDVVRDAWGFDGVTVSDWFGTHDTLASAQAGLDLEMPGPGRFFGPALADAVRRGEVDEREIDERVERMVRLVARADASTSEPIGARDGTERGLLAEAAAAGFVLVRNDGDLLPLDSSRTIAVIGPNAGAPCLQGGTFARISLEPGVVDPVAALTHRFGAVVHEPGADADAPLPSMKPLSPCADREGTPGFRVDYLRPDGSVAATELRDTNLLVWFGSLPGVGPIDAAGPGTRVRVSGTIRPSADGDHDFLVAGTGAITLTVDGLELVEGGSRAQPEDAMGALLHGEISSGWTSLQAGAPTRIVVDMELGEGRAHGLRFGCRPPVIADLAERAQHAAAAADVAVAIVGESQDASLESADRTTTHLLAAQEALVRQTIAANPRTVVVINAAHAVDLACTEGAAAVLFAWYPGQEFGPALAAVLSGDREPGGRMPIVVARDESDYPAFDLTPNADNELHYRESVLVGQRSLDAAGVDPAIPLGHGLGYADFRYDELTSRVEPDGTIVAEVTITNVSDRRGKEVVQLYVGLPPSSVVRPVQQLGAFAVRTLDAGATATITMRVPRRTIQRYEPGTQTWQMDLGEYELRAGRSSRDIRLRQVLMRRDPH
jgi:beta-glucosidase